MPVIFREELCKGCELCASACARHLISLAPHFNALGYHPARLENKERCNDCTLCALMCPDLAIEIQKEETA